MNSKTESSTPEKIVLRYRNRDTAFGVTRATAQQLARVLGLSETQVVHRALAEFARQQLRQYLADDAPLSAKQIRAIRKLAEQSDYKPTETLIDGL